MTAELYITRPEFSEVRSDLREAQNDIIEIRTNQKLQGATLTEILSEVKSKNSIREMLIAGGSGVGGGMAVGLYVLFQWLHHQ